MKACLIGKTLKHSFSKEIHQSLGLEYDLCEVAPERLYEFVELEKYDCFNVTIPYKEDIIPFLDEIDVSAAAVGAVNTVLVRNGKKTGYNTDIYGLAQTFKRKGVSPKGKNVVVLGSGGTSKTACAFLRQSGAKKITVISRSGAWNYENYHLLSDTQILINATPVGMFPNVDQTPVDLSYFPNLSFVMDVVYNPLKTELLSQAERAGIAYENGLPMLVYQAVRAEEIWKGQSIPAKNAERVLFELNREKTNVILVGMPGCGKTSVGRILAQKLGKRFVDLDEKIEREEGVSISEIFQLKGEAYFREKESQTARKFALQNNLVISTGGGTPISSENRAILRKNGIVFWLLRELNLLSAKNRPVTQREGVQALFEKRKEFYNAASDYTVENRNLPSDTAEEIKELYEKDIRN